MKKWLSLIPRPIQFGMVIGFLLFCLLAILDGKFVNLGESLLLGLTFTAVGGALGIPFHLVLRRDVKQELIEKHQGLELTEPQQVQGLWNFRGALVIDPQSAIFPPRCIFSNEPVAQLLPFTVGQIKLHGVGAIRRVSKKTTVEFLPISRKWLEQQRSWGQLLRWPLLSLAIVLLVGGILVGIVDPKQEPVVILSISAAILIGAVGAALPHLSGFNGQREIYSAFFLADGKILIVRPHRDFVAQLPVFDRGFRDDQIGIERLIKESTDHARTKA